MKSSLRLNIQLYNLWNEKRHLVLSMVSEKGINEGFTNDEEYNNDAEYNNDDTSNDILKKYQNALKRYL